MCRIPSLMLLAAWVSNLASLHNGRRMSKWQNDTWRAHIRRRHGIAAAVDSGYGTRKWCMRHLFGVSYFKEGAWYIIRRNDSQVRIECVFLLLFWILKLDLFKSLILEMMWFNDKWKDILLMNCCEWIGERKQWWLTISTFHEIIRHMFVSLMG